MKALGEIYKIRRDPAGFSLTEEEVELLDAVGRYAESDGSIFVCVEREALEGMAGDDTVDDDVRRLAARLLELLPWEDGVCDLEICM